MLLSLILPFTYGWDRRTKSKNTNNGHNVKCISSVENISAIELFRRTFNEHLKCKFKNASVKLCKVRFCRSNKPVESLR